MKGTLLGIIVGATIGAAATAGAVATKVVTLSPGDGAFIGRTKIYCSAARNGVTCLPPKVGQYAVQITRGYVSVHKIRNESGDSTVVFYESQP